MSPRGAWHHAAGVTNRRPEGTEPARRPAGSSPQISGHTAWWGLGSRLPCHVLQNLRSQVPDQVHSDHMKESSWTAASCTESLQWSPQLPPREAFGEGWQFSNMAGTVVQAAGLNHQHSRHCQARTEQVQCPRKDIKHPGQQNPSSSTAGCPWVTPGFTGVYTSTSPPWSFSCALSAALTQQRCPWGRASGAVPSAQPLPLPRLRGTKRFWDLCSSLGCGLGQMGFAVGGRVGVKLHKQAHTRSHAEKIWLKKPCSWISTSKGNCYLTGHPQPGLLHLLHPKEELTFCWKTYGWIESNFAVFNTTALLGDHFFPGSTSQSKQRLIPHWKAAGASWYFILMAKKYEVPLLCRSFSKTFAAWFSQARRRGQTWS